MVFCYCVSGFWGIFIYVIVCGDEMSKIGICVPVEDYENYEVALKLILNGGKCNG